MNLNPRREEFSIIFLSKRLFNSIFGTSEGAFFAALILVEDSRLHALIVAFFHAVVRVPISLRRRCRHHCHHNRGGDRLDSCHSLWCLCVRQLRNYNVCWWKCRNINLWCGFQMGLRVCIYNKLLDIKYGSRRLELNWKCFHFSSRGVSI